jgi:hypothetical protein
VFLGDASSGSVNALSYPFSRGVWGLLGSSGSLDEWVVVRLLGLNVQCFGDGKRTPVETVVHLEAG